MFTEAHFKLTVFYSIFFFILFWLFSFGLYVWMERSFGEGYITQVKQQHAQRGQNTGEFDDSKATVVTIAGDVALSRLAKILIILNSGLLFVNPVTSWFLARRTLKPIKKAHETQRQFVSDASHELRTPLSIMLGEVDIALQKQRSQEYYQQILLSNQEELNRLSMLVESLLFLAREDQNKHKLQFERVDLTDLISSVIASLSLEYKKKNLKINFNSPEESLTTLGNSSLLNQLFYNLLDNAIKYTPAKGTITVLLSKKYSDVEILIKDTGVGIPAAIQDRIFERFYRADLSRSMSKGNGLGLSICRVIVNRHHGTLNVSSRAGKGSKFVVSLPSETRFIS